jgi:hypothetical protein
LSGAILWLLANSVSVFQRSVAHVMEMRSVVQWEYMTIDLAEMHRKSDDATVLNRAGAEGWELVSITLRNIAYLKRQLGKPANRTKSVS